MSRWRKKLKPEMAILCRRARPLDLAVAGSQVAACDTCDTTLVVAPSSLKRRRQGQAVLSCWTCWSKVNPGATVEFLDDALDEVNRIDPALIPRMQEMRGMPVAETYLADGM